jgi:hypothetical protein
MPYHQARELCVKEFGVQVPLASFTPFWDEVCGPEILRRRKRISETAKACAEEARKDPTPMPEATIDLLQQAAFEQALRPGADPRTVKSLFSLVLKAKDQVLAAAKVQLEREKFEFDAAKAALAKLPELKSIQDDRGLDEDAKLLAVRERLFGVVPV